MKKNLQTIIQEINKLPRPTIVGISGFGGSGKSTLAKLISKDIDIPIIGVDSFSKSNVHDGYDRWDIMNYYRLEKEVIRPFKSGENEILYGDFDWVNNEIGKQKRVKHDGVIIIEGVGLFRPELIKYFSYTIWIDCPLDEAIKRGKKRDLEEYDNPQDEYWDGIWKRNDEQCFKEFLPLENVDAVIEYFKH